MKSKEEHIHRHHYIPQHYLKGFGVMPSYQYAKVRDIWVYTKGSFLEPKFKSINEIAFVKDFYAFEREDGEIDYDTYEKLFNSGFENPATPILDKIRNKQTINNKEKNKLSKYICLLMIRGKLGQTIFCDAKNLEQRQIKENLEKQGYNKDEIIQAMKNFIANEEEVRKGERDNIRRKEITEKYSSLIFNLNWQFLLAPKDHRFMTCDVPVCYEKLNTEEALLILPISSQICLLATFTPYPKHSNWNDENGFWEIDTTAFEGICDKITRRAVFEVYFSENSEYLTKFVNDRLDRFTKI